MSTVNPTKKNIENKSLQSENSENNNKQKSTSKKNHDIREYFGERDFLSFGVDKVLHEAETEFQKVLIADTFSYGRILYLDGYSQSAEYDEYVYHEALIHPVLANLNNPKKVLIIGGGEGATAREVLKYPNIQEVHMVDIDGELVEICKEHLPGWSDGAFNDTRLKVFIQDALDFVTTKIQNLKQDDKYDFIVVDLVDPADIEEDSPIQDIYKGNFLNNLKDLLTDSGALVIQSSEFNQGEFDSFAEIYRKIITVFKNANPYYCFVPSFISEWGFIACSQTQQFNQISAKNVDANLNNASPELTNQLSYYDGITHEKIFALSKDLRYLIQNDFVEID